MDSIPIRRALISVSDKMGLGDFARGLEDNGVEIYSTGGTRAYLEELGIHVHDLSGYTGFPEMMDGRLKTLHPKVFGGILCRYDNPSDMAAIEEHGIHSFELVVVNLYPFEATISRLGVTHEEAIEKIDIGGPSLVRAAAKNHHFTTIATSSTQYFEILEQLGTLGGTTKELRTKLASDAFALTASYDRAIADYFHEQEQEDSFPEIISPVLHHKATLRYGENPHQQAAVYRFPSARGANLVNARQLNGKELSYNNLLDLDSALSIARSLPDAGACAIKHHNPCGAASAETLVDAAEKAMEGDPVSAFGSVLGFNQTVDVETAEALSRPGLFVEAIVAPDYEAAAVGILTTKPKWKNNVRLMQVGDLTDGHVDWQYRHIQGGMLVQQADDLLDPLHEWEVVTDIKPHASLEEELYFAWQTVRHVKSNAIVLCRDRMLIGVGAGQMSRVDSVEIAIKKGGDRVKGSVLASDAFFPFADSVYHAAGAGVRALIQPGGSKRDQEVIDACNELGVTMIFTNRRHFKH
ncbi:MAG: bifunctional phosphoribosylaminoimidazolecarboxamide formyltransferase/IMP cyclohydrolase [Pirellulaceae bacterium]|nr:bifunctional phosphoribosylaminoimidazolecarboxamide formyltransferase/IMP cyclohydrolase [Pirellulaceae bacterium]